MEDQIIRRDSYCSSLDSSSDEYSSISNNSTAASPTAARSMENTIHALHRLSLYNSLSAPTSSSSGQTALHTVVKPELMSMLSSSFDYSNLNQFNSLGSSNGGGILSSLQMIQQTPRRRTYRYDIHNSPTDDASADETLSESQSAVTSSSSSSTGTSLITFNRIANMQRLIKKVENERDRTRQAETQTVELLREQRKLHRRLFEVNAKVKNLERKINYYGNSNFTMDDYRDDTSIAFLFHYFDSDSTKSFDAETHSIIKSVIESPGVDPTSLFDQLSQTVSHPLGVLKEAYSSMLHHLRHHPEYLARTAKYVKFNQLDKLTNIVVFSMYGNLFHKGEERLLLNFIGSILRHDFTNFNGDDAINFLRANTFGTKLLTQYTKRGGGKVYLTHALKDSILELLAAARESPYCIEIDPLKIYQQALKLDNGKKDRKDMFEEPKVKAMIEQNLPVLEHFCHSFVNRIFETVNLIPHGIRWIGKQLYLLAKDRFNPLTDTQKNAIVGSFIFLRFLLPAVIAPDKLCIVDAKIETEARTCLTLIAKCLEKLANGTLFGEKEWFMIPMNDFLRDFKPALTKFITELIDVDDPCDTYTRSSGAEIVSALHQSPSVITISPNDLFLLHSVFYDNLNSIFPSKDDKLRTLIDSMGVPPKQLEKNNKFVMLNVGFQVPRDYRKSRRGATPSRRFSVNMMEMEDMHFRALEARSNSRIQLAVKKMKEVLYEIDSVPNNNEIVNITQFLEQEKTKAAANRKEALVTKIDECIAALNDLSSPMKESEFGNVLSLIDREYNLLETYHLALLDDKYDLETKITELSEEVHSMNDDLKAFTTHLENAKQQSFLRRLHEYNNERKRKERPSGFMDTLWKLTTKRKPTWITNASPPESNNRIGPLTYSVTELMEQKVVNPPNNLKNNLNNSNSNNNSNNILRKGSTSGNVLAQAQRLDSAEIELSCESPGIINMKIKTIQRSQGEESQLCYEYDLDTDNMLDQVLVTDTITLGGLSFDLRRLLLLINNQFNG